MPGREHSERLFERARAVIPGGVNSPVRAFNAVGGTPPFIARAEGAWIEDVDGNRYVDYVASWGPMLLGHAYPACVEAVREAASGSTSFGAPTRIEVEVAELVCELMPSIERVRMVNSGTEATMSAVRLARGATGRPYVVKFAGHYHGHADYFLIAAGSGATTFGRPNSPGVTAAAAAETLVARFNDVDSVRGLFQRYPGEIACVIVEPVAGNMGCVPPEPGFLQALRAICDETGALLIFDEVMTGFRVARGGAQERYGVKPDLTTLGKIIGGGLPVGAYGGRADLMEQVAPSGPIYQAGTLSGNPVAMAAGYAMLRRIADDDGLYNRLEAYGSEWDERLREILVEVGKSYYMTRVGSMGTLFFTERRVIDYDTARTSDTAAYARYFHAMLDQGIYLAPSQFEAWFVSAAHGREELERTVRAQREALARVR
ncbi:MAG TPA: glutamate-1-semialdehyde 2,1-aminomutase [Rhodothermales bacterium]